jgi:hypothetical protein
MMTLVRAARILALGIVKLVAHAEPTGKTKRVKAEMSEAFKIIRDKAAMIDNVRRKLYERGLVKTGEEACKAIAVIDVLDELNKLVNGHLKEIVDLMFERGESGNESLA